MNLTARFELDVPRTRTGPRVARQRLADWIGAEGDDRELGDAMLLTCELVTNAVIHGRGKVEMRAQLDEDRLMVEVIDQGTGFEPAARERNFDAFGGWGLNLVDAIASRWGIHEGRSHVWFELERPGRAYNGRELAGCEANGRQMDFRRLAGGRG